MSVVALPSEENIRTWLEELRSGKWKQGKGKLHTKYADVDELCCLGVACAAPSVGRHLVSAESFEGVVSYGRHTAFLPTAVQRHLGIDAYGSCNPDMISDKDPVFAQLPRGEAEVFGERPTLMMLNDAGLTFSQIADFIERNIKALKPYTEYPG